MNIHTAHVVEWSDYQQCFHVDTLATSMRHNIDAFLSGQPIQFAMIAVVESYDKATELRKQLEEGRSKLVNKLFNPPQE